MALLITFAPENPDVRERVTSAIKQLGEWSELTPTSYLVETTGAGGIMELLQPLLGRSCSLWVFTVSAPWAAHGDPIVEDHAIALVGDFEDSVPKDWDHAEGRRC